MPLVSGIIPREKEQLRTPDVPTYREIVNQTLDELEPDFQLRNRTMDALFAR